MNTIRKATRDDISGIVSVHLDSFKDFFLTFLGRRFLELMYREIMNESGSVCLVALSDQNRVVGFAAGVSNQVGLYRRLAKQRWFAFGFAASHVALLHPSIILRLFRALRYPAVASHLSSPALLMSIAVAPDAKGGGIGRGLVNEFLREMTRLGVDRICLTTDRDKNEKTNSFYQKLGFSIAQEYQTREGRWMYEYVGSTTELTKD